MKPGNVGVGLEQSVWFSLNSYTSHHRCCCAMKTALVMLVKFYCCYMNRFSQTLHACIASPPSHYWCVPPHPVVGIKRWCIQQSMVVTPLCCYPLFLLGPQCDLVRLLRLDNQHSASVGEGECVCVCVYAFVCACVWMYSYNVRVCVYSMFGWGAYERDSTVCICCTCLHMFAQCLF